MVRAGMPRSTRPVVLPRAADSRRLRDRVDQAQEPPTPATVVANRRTVISVEWQADRAMTPALAVRAARATIGSWGQHEMTVFTCCALLAGCGDEVCDPEAADTICTIVGTGTQGGPLDGPAHESPLYLPIDLAMSPDGELWVIDFNNYLVRAVDARGMIRTVVGSGEVGNSPAQGIERVAALEADLNHISDLVFHEGYLYLAAWHNSFIKRVRLSDMTLENYAGTGKRLHYDGDGGPALAASLDLPAALAIAPDGQLAIMDQANQVIRAIDATGVIRTIAGQCIADYYPECAPGEQPAACAGSQKWVCGASDGCERQLCSPSFAGDGGPALEARIGQPFGAAVSPSGHLAYDPAGNLYFTDTDNHRIRKIDPAGVITTIAGTGMRGFAGDDGPAREAQMSDPIDIALAPDGTIYFTDTYNSCIRKIDPTGRISRVVGRCSADPKARGFAGDGGAPLDALLDRPYGIHLAGDKLYIADSYNHRIRVANLRR